MKRLRTIVVNAEWEVEYEFGTGLRAAFWGWVFGLAERHVSDCTLVRIGTVKGGIHAIADAIAVESIIAETR